jgi:hypothetical protein
MSIAVSSCSLLVCLLPLPNRDDCRRHLRHRPPPRSGRLAGGTIILAADVGRQRHDNESPVAVAFGGRRRRIVRTRSIDVTPSAHSSHEGPVDAFPPFVARFASLKDSNWHVEGGESRQLGVVN